MGIINVRTASRQPTGRHGYRDTRGRFAARVDGDASVTVRPGGYDAVVGHRPEGWIPAVEQVHTVRPDYSGYAALSTLLDDGSYPAHLRRTV